MSSSRFMTTVMCDDVRREEGNKVSHMGIYGPTLLVPQFPTALAKLCFVMSVTCPASEPSPKSLVFRLLQNDEVMGEIVMPERPGRRTATGGRGCRCKATGIRGGAADLSAAAGRPLQATCPCTVRR